MNDPVRVALLGGKFEGTRERSYAEANDLKILEGEPVYAKGRLRGTTRRSGRKRLPATDIPKAIPGEPATTTETPGSKAGEKTRSNS